MAEWSKCGAPEPATRDAQGPPGSVLDAGAAGLVVACGTGALRLGEVQPAGAQNGRDGVCRGTQDRPRRARRRRRDRDLEASQRAKPSAWLRSRCACSTVDALAALAALARRASANRSAGAALSSRSSHSARCDTALGACAQARRQALSDPALACFVAVAIHQLDHTRAPSFAIVDHAVNAAAVPRDPRRNRW
jgi:hypothetical protein